MSEALIVRLLRALAEGSGTRRGLAQGMAGLVAIGGLELLTRKGEWLPTDEDKAYIQSLMIGVTEPGKFANYIAPPQRGINRQPIDFEYVKCH